MMTPYQRRILSAEEEVVPGTCQVSQLGAHHNIEFLCFYSVFPK